MKINWELVLKGILLLCLAGIVVCFVGCSSKWHMKRAVKKDPSIQKEMVDTIRFTQTFIDTVYTSDSTFYIEHREVHYDTIIKWTKVQADFSEMKTWWETLQEEKTNRKQIKNDRKENQTETRQDAKTDRTEIRQEGKSKRGRSWWWLWMILGGVSFFLIRFLTIGWKNWLRLDK